MLELIVPSEMAKIDAAAIAAGVSGPTLMENAGAAVADVAARSFRDARRVLILAGPGNNGGDGFVAARRLAEAGHDVVVALLGDRSALSGDAAWAASGWVGETIEIESAPFERAELVIDALFGAGLSRPLHGRAAEAVTAANAAASRSFRSTFRAVSTARRGLPLGALHQGRRDRDLREAEAGPRAGPRPRAVRQGPSRSTSARPTPRSRPAPSQPGSTVRRSGARLFPSPRSTGTNIRAGHVAVWSGPALATGASRLAALSALRAGAGAVTLVGSRAALKVHAAHVTAVMLREVDGRRRAGPSSWPSGASTPGCSVPARGTGDDALDALDQGFAAGGRIVLDADVFSIFADRPEELGAAIEDGGGEAVLTPHEGEFARLMGERVEAGQSKLDRAKAAAALTGSIVVLKGPDTVVAAPGRPRLRSPTTRRPISRRRGRATCWRGLIAGLLAQGTPAFEAASAAVWLHGEAAKAVGRGLIADDLPGAIPAALSALDGPEA